MWYKTGIDVWKMEIGRLKLPVFYDADFLTATSNVFNTRVDYYILKKKKNIVGLAAFHVKNRSIVTPESFTFSALWFSDQLGDVSFIESATSLIKTLKGNYTKVSIKLNPLIKDIRPFSWANFQIENKYTYLKKDAKESHYSVSKNLSKLPENFYVFKVESMDRNSLESNLKFLKAIGFSTKICERYNCLLNNWDNLGILKAFNLYKENRLICSNIVILDKEDSKAYTILLNNASKEEKYAHTYLYQSIIDWCEENDIREVDLCGANLPSVAKFKSYFNAELVGYFLLSYSPLQAQLINLKGQIKRHLKKIKNKIS